MCEPHWKMSWRSEPPEPLGPDSTAESVLPQDNNFEFLDVKNTRDTNQHLARLLWATNQAVIRSRLIDGGYRFSVEYNGEPHVQRFVVDVNNVQAKIWPNPSTWGKTGECYWGVFVEDGRGNVVGREYPDYDPQDCEACPSGIEALFEGLGELKLR